jgi:hypothetical protein
MTDAYLRAKHLLSAVAPPPRTDALMADACARLDMLTRAVLPAIRRERAFLSAVWRSDDPDAARLEAFDGSVIACDPIGKDRIASVLASESAFALDAAALHELTEALRVFELGGRDLIALTDDGTVAEPDRAVAPVAGTRRGGEPHGWRGYRRQLRAYLEVVERDRAGAITAGSIDDVVAYSRERDVILERLRQPRPSTVGRGRRRSRRVDRPVTVARSA